MNIHLLSDHKTYLASEDGGGNQGEIIDGRPAGLLTATRTESGDLFGGWQTFTIVFNDDGTVSLQSLDKKKFLCCENAEEDAKADRNGQLIFNRDEVGSWEKFELWELADGRYAFESLARPGWFIKAWGNGKVELAQPYANEMPVSEPGGFESFTSEPPIRQGGVNPGGHRFVGHVHLRGDGFYDSNGTIRFVGVHVGNLFGLFCRNENETLEAVRTISIYPAVQFWMQLGSIPGSTYWHGEELGPRVTPNYWGKFERFRDLLASFGMKAIVCGGDFYGWTHDDTRELAYRCNETVALYIVGNEAWQTGADNKEELQKHIGVFKQFNTVVPCTTTAPPTEDASEISKWCAGDFYAMHGYRGGEDHDRIRHIFSVPWEGHPPSRYGYQDEWTGPGSEVSVKASHCYHGRDVDANHMCAGAVMSLLTNQGFNYFCSEGVRYSPNIVNRAGFREVANVHTFVPQDIMTWAGPMHSGSSQPNRAFDLVSGNHLRVDHRYGPGGRIFGLAYGDQGTATFRMRHDMHLIIRNMDGTILHKGDFNDGEQYSLNFQRSQNGEPGFTAVIIDGHLR